MNETIQIVNVIYTLLFLMIITTSIQFFFHRKRINDLEKRITRLENKEDK